MSEERHVSKQAVWVTLVAVCAFLGVVGAATSHRWISYFQKKENPLCDDSVVETITELGLQGNYAELRTWMKEVGPEKTKYCVSAVDGRFDRFGQARIEILKALATMKDEGLSEPLKAEWGQALAHSARKILRPGPAQDEYLRLAEVFVNDKKRDPATQR